MATDRAWIDRARKLGYNMLAIGTDTGLLAAATSELTAYAGRSGS
jgi:2-keto-3-deoxy-L-rhamnonate aldolase RhmA